MKRIVVTGAQGGTGVSIVRYLRERGFDVLAADMRPSTKADGQAVQVNLADAAAVNDLFSGAGAIVHFGSPPGIGHLPASQAFRDIAIAGFNVFRAAQNVGVQRIVWASSIEVYGPLNKHARLPITEESHLEPSSLYGGCKIVLERLALDVSRWSGMGIAGLRLSRIIYENDEGRAKLRRLVETPDSGADCLWSYIDARDVAAACLAWIDSDHPGAEIFNLAAPDVHKTQSTADLLKRSDYSHLAAPENLGASETPFCSRKIQRVLGWQARYDWRKILSEKSE